MGLGRWLLGKLDHDDGYEPDPDEVVDVATLDVGHGAMAVARLAQVGIRAQRFERRLGYYGPPKTVIMCFARDREAAAAIVDEVMRDVPGPSAD